MQLTKDEQIRLPNGIFAQKSDVEPAVFRAKPPEYTCVMESAIRGERKGKKIKFKNGVYKTKDMEEIEFLKNKKAGLISRVAMVQEIRLKEDAEVDSQKLTEEDE